MPANVPSSRAAKVRPRNVKQPKLKPKRFQLRAGAGNPSPRTPRYRSGPAANRRAKALGAQRQKPSAQTA